MSAQLAMSVIQIALGIVLSCTALLKPEQPRLDPTQSAQPAAVPASVPFAPLIGVSGLAIAALGLYGLYKELLAVEPSEENLVEAPPIPIVIRQENHQSVSQNVQGVPSASAPSKNRQVRDPISAPPAAAYQPEYEYQYADPSPALGAAYAAAEPDADFSEEWVLPLRNILARAETSWVLCGSPGVGKTTFLLEWMADAIALYPNIQFFINGWKNDDWLGLAGIGGVYRRNTPRPDRRDGFDGFFTQVSKTAKILYERLDVPAKERQQLKRDKPIWLVLDDYFATSDALNKTKGELAGKWENAKAELGQIITLGREVGVALCVATHSLNIKSLGLEDASVRGCLSLCALCKVFSSAQGRREGGYEAINNALRNPYIISPEHAQVLAPTFGRLRGISERSGLPIALATFGEPAIGLVDEDLSWVPDFRIPIAPPATEKPDPSSAPASEEPNASNLIKFPRIPEPWDSPDTISF